MIRYFISFLFIPFALSLHAQDSLPKFGSPVDFPIILSGNFAEMRNNHFHTGLDIKTGGAEGKRIISADEGRVARIAVSPYGYGRALYIEHPNGYTTVYAHLKSFSDKINAFVKAEQYAKKSFAVDFTPTETVAISKGELIALSGNTGGSGGPHLHFEIRETDTERPQNPLLFGFDITDNLPPVMRGVRFHPLTDTTLINGKNEAQSFVLTGQSGKYAIKAGTKISVYGAFGVSLHAIDFLNAASNKCGVYEVMLQVDGTEICRQDFRELDFSTNRQINCYKDFESFRKKGWHYHKSFREPGNELPIYRPLPPDDGIISFSGQGTHTAEYEVKDAYGNLSKLSFEFESLGKPNGTFAIPEDFEAYFSRERENTYEYEDEFKLRIPAKSLYRDLPLQFGVQMKTAQTMSAQYVAHNEFTPLDKQIELEISVRNVKPALRPYLVAARYPIAGGPAFIPVVIEGDFAKFKSKEFGKFTLMTDSIPPTMTAEKPGGTVTSTSSIGFTINDGRSGIRSHEAYLNGEWVLMEYEPKQKRIWLVVKDTDFKKGSNKLEVVITDNCGNQNRKSFTYTL